MALTHFAYVFLSPGFTPEKNTVMTKNEDCTFVAVGIDLADKSRVIDVAIQLVDQGVQMIELCGGFGPLWIARISEAIGHAVPVGSVAYGPEARQPLLDILSPTVAVTD